MLLAFGMFGEHLDLFVVPQQELLCQRPVSRRPRRCQRCSPFMAPSRELSQPERQIPIWCFSPLTLLCSVNDAVDVLPCATWSYLKSFANQGDGQFYRGLTGPG